MWAILLALGFIIGIIYENLAYESHSDSSVIFNEYFLQQFATSSIVAADYMKYIFRERITQFAIISVLCCLKWKKIIVRIFLVWIGFLLGVLMVSAIIWQGLKGIPFCFAILLPHMFFYGVSCSIILWVSYIYPEETWKMKHIIIAIISFLMGVLSETYVTPSLVKLVVNLF